MEAKDLKNLDETVDNFKDFTKQSMDWCQKQSEEATSGIMDIINSLVEDTKTLSKQSVETFQQLKGVVTQSQTAKKVQQEVKISSAAAEALNRLKEKDNEVEHIIGPVIEALQFQDRISQNIDNFGKMLRLWQETRQTLVASGAECTSEHIEEFGKELLKCTTMEDERKIIRSVIPNLPEEEEEQDALLF